MGIPDHLTCLLRNLYAGQEATVRTGHGTTDWFQIVSEWVELLLDQALLAERGTLEDPNLFIRRMNQLLVS